MSALLPVVVPVGGPVPITSHCGPAWGVVRTSSWQPSFGWAVPVGKQPRMRRSPPELSSGGMLVKNFHRGSSVMFSRRLTRRRTSPVSASTKTV